MTIEQRTTYGFGTKTTLAFGEALDQTKAALKEQGFGVLTEIDVQQTLKEKRGVSFRAYTILGACNPPLAERALNAELDIGLLLPCNVIVYAEDGGAVVEALDPEAALGIVGNPLLDELAREAKERLKRALGHLPSA